jgi:hypothetical protein
LRHTQRPHGGWPLRSQERLGAKTKKEVKVEEKKKEKDDEEGDRCC